MSDSRSDVKRLDRIAGFRETMASAAEARVHEAQLRVREIELQEQAILRQIQHIRAEITQHHGFCGQHAQQNEKFIAPLNKQRVTVLQALENAKKVLAQRQTEWMEARREHRVIERLQEKRLLQWRRQQDVALQKAADDTFVGKLVREKSKE